MIATLIASMLVSQSPVSYETYGLSLNKVLAQLSAQTSQELSAAANIAETPMVISVKDVSTDQLLTKIAEAASAEWVDKEPGKRQLVRTEKVRKAIWDAAVKRREAELSERLQKLRETVGKRKPFSKELVGELAEAIRKANDSDDRDLYNQMWKLYRTMPDQRLGDDLALSINPKIVAALRYDDAIVYATEPNRMQQPMPSAMRTVIERFLKDQAVVANEVETLGIIDSEEDYWGLSRTFKPTSVTRATIRINRAWGSSDLYGTIEFTSKGKRLQSYSFSTSSEDEEATIKYADMGGDGQAYEDEDSVPAWLAKASAKDPIELSPDAQLSIDCFRFAQSMAVKAPENFSALQDKIRRPDEHEPFSVLTGELFSKAARHSGFQLVMAPQDALSLLRIPAKPAELTPRNILNDLRSNWARTALSFDHGWLVARPDSLDEGQNPFWTDRKTLRGMMQRSEQAGYSRLADWIAISDPYSESDYENRTYLYVRILCPRDPFMVDVGEPNVRRLIGTLSGPQVQGLQQGKAVRFGELPPASRGILDTMFYKLADLSLSRASWEDESSEREDGPPPYEGPEEATDIWPNGLPANATITFKTEVSQGFALTTQRSDRPNQGPTTSYALHAMIGRTVFYNETRATKNEILELRPLTVTQTSVILTIPPYPALKTTFLDQSMDRTIYKKWQDVPEADRKKIEEAINALRNPKPPQRSPLNR